MPGGRSLWRTCHGRLMKPSNRAGRRSSRDDYRNTRDGKWRKSRPAAKKTVHSLPSGKVLDAIWLQWVHRQTHVSNILLCNGHNTPKERQHYKWYIAFIVYIHVTWGFELVCYLISCLNIFFKLFTGHIEWIVKHKLLVNYWYKIIDLHVCFDNFSCTVLQGIST